MEPITPKNIDATKFMLMITGRQARVIENALEMYSRVHMGQMDAIKFAVGLHEIPRTEHLKTYKNLPDRLIRGVDYPALYFDVNHTLDHLKMVLFPELEPNSYWGITNPELPEDARISWDLYQVIRYHTSWEAMGWPEKRDWKTMLTVNYDDPMKTSDEKLARMDTL